MLEFCPVCSKNEVKSRIKAYQLNLQEAVFMCSAEKCTWPVGYQELTFINRLVGKDWSSNWDEAAAIYLKSEPELLLDFTAYTPPQTPGTEVSCKDVTNSTISSTVPCKVFNSLPTFVDEITDKSQKFCTTVNKRSSASIDSSIKVIDVKPKLVNSKVVNYKVTKLPEKGYKFSKNNENTIFPNHNTQLKNSTNNSTSLASNTALKNHKSNNSLCTDSTVKDKCKSNLKILVRRKTKARPYEKFDFNELLKAKSVNVKKDVETNSHKVDKKAKTSERPFKVLHKKVNDCSLSYENFDLDKFLNSDSTNIKKECNNVDYKASNKSNVDSCINGQNEFEAALGLTDSSKDSGVSYDLIENNDVDLNLEDLLSGFSDDMGNTMKSEMNDIDECNWINSLFE